MDGTGRSGRRVVRTVRRTLLVLCLLTLVSVVAVHPTEPLDTTPRADSPSATANVTFVSAQGEFWNSEQDRIVALDPATGHRIWAHTAYDSYYDIDPLNQSTLLFVGNAPASGWRAVVLNWQTGVEYRNFSVPLDTHDVDHVRGATYVIADKETHALSVYNASTDETQWRYNFTRQFPETASEEPYTGDFTHLNDVDVVETANGTGFLVSPREFDRVLLIDRDTKQVTFSLGADGNHDVLFEQHNPVLLSQSPPTLLVADSENNRVVEYTRRNGSWTQTWVYAKQLIWPRDADRLPNGNTLIVDTYGQRVLEVTPDKEIVWEQAVTTHPYDIERVAYGEEPTGPPMHEVQPQANPEETVWSGLTTMKQLNILDFRSHYLWLSPTYIDYVDFLLVTVTGLGLLGYSWTALIRFFES